MIDILSEVNYQPGEETQPGCERERVKHSLPSNWLDD
jgi:hypothetical protein